MLPSTRLHSQASRGRCSEGTRLETRGTRLQNIGARIPKTIPRSRTIFNNTAFSWMGLLKSFKRLLIQIQMLSSTSKGSRRTNFLIRTTRQVIPETRRFRRRLQRTTSTTTLRERQVHPSLKRPTDKIHRITKVCSVSRT